MKHILIEKETLEREEEVPKELRKKLRDSKDFTNHQNGIEIQRLRSYQTMQTFFFGRHKIGQKLVLFGNKHYLFSNVAPAHHRYESSCKRKKRMK